MLTSIGCKMLVIPPGMMASVVSFCFRARFVLTVLWHRKASNTSKLLVGFLSFPQNRSYPVQRQCFIHPALLVVPDDDSRWELFFRHGLSLEDDERRQLPPSAVQASITVSSAHIRKGNRKAERMRID